MFDFDKMKISVIVPVYNVEQYVLECLLSVANQTMTNGVECILIDDCGNDNSMTIANNFLLSYTGNICFKLHSHPINKGLSAARNTGILMARGKYLFFLDSDDVLKPNCLEMLYMMAERYNSDLVVGSYTVNSCNMERYNKIDLPEFTEDKSFIKKTLLNYDRMQVMAQNKMVRRDFVLEHKLFFQKGVIHEDVLWTFFLAKYVENMVICKERVYFYRSTPGSITNDINVPKEIQSYRTMIQMFSRNLDTFEINAQKRLIFCLLLIAVRNGYFEDEIAKENLINCLRNRETFINRILIFLIFHTKNLFLQARFINLLMRIYEK